jgi:hypothetical protein
VDTLIGSVLLAASNDDVLSEFGYPTLPVDATEEQRYVLGS